MAEAKKIDPRRVVTSDQVRFSFVNVFEMRKDEESGREAYSIQILIPKTDTETIAKYNAALEHTKADAKSAEVWGGKFLASYKVPLRDGDTERDTDKHPEYKGMWFINASTTMKPNIVDAAVAPILDKSQVYSGAYGRVSFGLYPYKQKGGIGIAAGLNNVQKLRDGDPLGGVQAKAEDDFGPASDDSFLG